MKYHLLALVVVLVSCNSSNEKATPVAVDYKLDSIAESFDTTSMNLYSIDTALKSFAKSYVEASSQVKELREEKKDLIQQLEQRYPNYQAIQSDDKHLIRIKELNDKLAAAEFQLTRLRRDSAYKSKVDRVPNKLQKIIEFDPIVPNSKSLIIDLDKKIIGDGTLSDNMIDVYIVPDSKKARKKLINHDTVCDMSELNKFNPVQAYYYQGTYFFNGIRPGRYIVKVCSYYGNAIVIERLNERQIVEMKALQ